MQTVDAASTGFCSAEISVGSADVGVAELDEATIVGVVTPEYDEPTVI